MSLVIHIGINALYKRITLVIMDSLACFISNGSKCYFCEKI